MKSNSISDRLLSVRRQAVLVFVVILVLSISGITAEFAVRFAEPELDPSRHLQFEEGPDGDLVLGPRNTEQRQIKNTGDFNVKIRFNRFGLRDSKDLATASAADIYMVGDSYTFGWGVEEPERVSERLEALTGRRVFNVSMPSGAFDGYERLLDYAAANGAMVREVIFAVSMETDLRIYGNAPIANATRRVGSKADPLRGLKVFLMKNSALYVLTTTLIHRSDVLKALAIRLGLMVPTREGVRQFEFSEQVIESSARRLQEIARRFKTTVIVLPSRALWSGSRQAIEKKRHGAFVSRIRDLGLDVVDLRTAFEEGGDPLSYHFANDPHWTPRGHIRAAEALAAHLKAKPKAP